MELSSIPYVDLVLEGVGGWVRVKKDNGREITGENMIATPCMECSSAYPASQKKILMESGAECRH